MNPIFFCVGMFYESKQLVKSLFYFYTYFNNVKYNHQILSMYHYWTRLVEINTILILQSPKKVQFFFLLKSQYVYEIKSILFSLNLKCGNCYIIVYTCCSYGKTHGLHVIL